MIAVNLPHRLVYGGTSCGLVRLENEDRFTFAFYQISLHNPTPVLLAIVADGVGGQNAGEKAASLVVDLIPDYLEKFEPGDTLRGLESAFIEANYEILRQAELIPAYAGMACTCAAVLVVGNQLFIANVGDSRIYWWRQGILKQISRDHTRETESSHTGFENPAENERKKPRSHVITRYLGSEFPPKVDLGLYLDGDEKPQTAFFHQGMELGKDDLILICSDGLTDMLTDEEIEIIIKTYPAQQLVENLTDAALKKGGEDNITLVIIGRSVSG